MVGVITAGGKGTRLSALAHNIPKPMMRILDKPILELNDIIEMIQPEKPVFGITGTNGKTTSTFLLMQMIWKYQLNRQKKN